MKVIRIDGIKGLFTAVFMAACLFAGFVISPGYAAMYLWNKYLVAAYMFPQLSLFQGVLLWAMIFLTYCILTKGRFAVSFQSSNDMRDEELESIIRSAKINSQLRMMNKQLSQKDKFVRNDKNPYSSDSVVDESNDLSDNNDENISEIK
jgi:hypothetical protein